MPSCAESERMSPQTTARQLEREATTPRINPVVGVILPSTENLRIPDFCRSIKSISIPSPRGRDVQIRSSFLSSIFFFERVYQRFWRTGVILLSCFSISPESAQSQ
jgi:hypothetical protein